MSDEPRVRQLLAEILDSERTPEQVCAACPELLTEVRKRWLQMRLVEAELDEGLVPAPSSSGSGLTPNGRRMLEAIDNLPAEEREAFCLVRIQGMTQTEAAQLLGVAGSTVKRRLNRGVQLLADTLADLRPG